MANQSRKFLLTINNPEEKGLTHEEIKRRIMSLTKFAYACIADEIGGKEKTYHTHCFVVYSDPKAWKTMKNLLPDAHVDCCTGTCSQNRDYVFKLGRHATSEKGLTAIFDTQEEWGEMPPEKAATDGEMGLLFDLVQDGLTTVEIIKAYPMFIKNITDIERTRLYLLEDKFKDQIRDIRFYYIQGKTGTGKTRGILEHHGYRNVFRVVNYNKNPFDNYRGEDVIVFEEYATSSLYTSFPLQSLLNYTDIQPLNLASRYSDKVACYTKIYITSNIPLHKQYEYAQRDPALQDSWQALLRRINGVAHFTEDRVLFYNSGQKYMDRNLSAVFTDYKQFHKCKNAFIPVLEYMQGWGECQCERMYRNFVKEPITEKEKEELYEKDTE